MTVRPVPDDFAQAFVRHGRQGCEEHYRAGRTTIDRWLVEHGKADLLAKRAAHVAATVTNWGETRSRPIRPCPPDFDGAYISLGLKGCVARYRVGWRTVSRWREERGYGRLEDARARYLGRKRGLSTREIGLAISKAYPVKMPNLRGDAE